MAGDDAWTKVVESITKALQELVTLEVRTTVGTLRPADPKAPDGPLVTEGEVHCIRSKIDLVQGDIQQQVDPWFLAPERKAVLEMHAAREKQAAEIIKSNVEALREMAKLVKDLVASPPTAPGDAPKVGR